MSKIRERVKEPSTYAGLAAILYGIGEIFKVHELAPLAGTVAEAGQTVATTGNLSIGIAGILAGILSVFLKEKPAR